MKPNEEGTLPPDADGSRTNSVPTTAAALVRVGFFVVTAETAIVTRLDAGVTIIFAVANEIHQRYRRGCWRNPVTSLLKRKLSRSNLAHTLMHHMAYVGSCLSRDIDTYHSLLLG